ncbi:MAG: rhomboid family intramembrane serine protease [Solirubrobacteraceae bacterium]|nr:rhomboid family intramembrane serine protease [Solirubrobacteraceae bacterium]
MIPLKDNIPTDRVAVVTIALIAINVFVYFVLERGGFTVSDDGLVNSWGVIPYELLHPGEETSSGSQPPAFVTAISSIFLHGSIFHLAGNMLFLWIFGNNIEDAMGRLKFIAFYLLGGLAAVLAQSLVDAGSHTPMIGASGAIAGVLGAYAVLYPRARVVTLIFIVIIFTVIELPAVLMLGLWIAQEIALGAADVGGTNGVAYFAHIGGFVAGAALIRAFATNVKQVPLRLS